MDTALSLSPNNLSLEQQVVRLQALLEATRQVHSTIKVQEVLTQAARILVRELEVDGALFLDPASGQPLVSYGELPAAPARQAGFRIARPLHHPPARARH